MLSKHTSTKPINKTTKSEEGYIVWSYHYNLPNKKVLFFTQDHKREKTICKIFSIYNLNSPLAEKTLEGNLRFLCIFPDGSILLNNRPFGESKLVKLCPDTLNIVSSQPWKHAYSAGAIDNESFFIVRKADDTFSGKLERLLSIYKWNGSSYMESSSTPLAAHPKTAGARMDDIQSLGKNRYCCHFQGHNTAEFRFLIFEIDPITNKVNELDIIKPKAQYSGGDSTASGSFVVLPNNQLLTYHGCHDNVQIWDTNAQISNTEDTKQTFKCVKEWNWADIHTPENFQVWCLKIAPFPDSVHLLVYKGEQFFLFNTHTLEMKQIEMTAKAQSYATHHILSTGQVLAFVTSNDHDHCVQIEQFDLKETSHVRKASTQGQHLSRFFFNQQGIPREITDHIFSYAFTPDAKEILAKKISDDNEDNEHNEKDINKKCLLM